jgi:ribosome biogenesis protein ERB1
VKVEVYQFNFLATGTAHTSLFKSQTIMAPRPVARAGVRSARVPSGSNGAGPSRVNGSQKKRAVEEVEDEEDEEDDDFAPVGQLELEADDEDDEELDDDDEDEEDFPELDSGSELADDDMEGDSEDELLDDEETGSESGYNTSDIEDMENDSDAPSSSTSAPPSRSSSFKDLTTDEQLSKMIAKNTIKPDDEVGTDGRISNAKQGHGKLVRSKLVDGGYKREYEDVEAGYGSESSTEDVSHDISTMQVGANVRTQTQSEMYPWNGTMTYLISDTM